MAAITFSSDEALASYTVGISGIFIGLCFYILKVFLTGDWEPFGKDDASAFEIFGVLGVIIMAFSFIFCHGGVYFPKHLINQAQLESSFL